MDNPHSSRAPDAREEMLAAVQNDGMALEYADDALKRDRDIVLAAVWQNVRASLLTMSSETIWRRCSRMQGATIRHHRCCPARCSRMA